MDTPDPTTEPTSDPTLEPTLSPTFGEVKVYLDNTACNEDRCGCNSDYISSECCYNNCDWDSQPAPVILVSEKSESDTTFYVRRTITNYPYALNITFNITAVSEQLADEYGFYSRIEQIEGGDYSLNDSNDSSSDNGINVTYTIPDDCYWNEWDDPECEHYIDPEVVAIYDCNVDASCSWCDFHDPSIAGPRCSDITPNSGQFQIPYTDLSSDEGGTFQQSTFDLSILRENCLDECDWKGEVFLLELTECTVIVDEERKNANGTDYDMDNGDVLNCSLTYPSKAYIIVVDQDPTQETELIEVADRSYEEWLWYVILGSVIVLAVLSYIAYRWWVNKKMKEADVAQVEEDMEAVIEEQEQGWNAANNANIAPANPLANIGIQRPDNATLPSPKAERIQDVAQVGVERFHERTEYGQQRGDNDNIHLHDDDDDDNVGYTED